MCDLKIAKTKTALAAKNKKNRKLSNLIAAGFPIAKISSNERSASTQRIVQQITPNMTNPP
jgi:hypothetical protein